MIDREQIVQNALGGYGTIGNDLACPFDQDYAHFPQRNYDPEQAKSLLKAAGQEHSRSRSTPPMHRPACSSRRR